MNFVRTRLGAFISKVLAWDACSGNDVGCEYIIMEKCVGAELARRLDTASDSSQQILNIAQSLSKLAAIPFSQYGSIYFKDDVDPSLPLYADVTQSDNCSERFCIGPSVDRRFDRSERAQMDIDRGPCEASSHFLVSLTDIKIYSE